MRRVVQYLGKYEIFTFGVAANLKIDHFCHEEKKNNVHLDVRNYFSADRVTRLVVLETAFAKRDATGVFENKTSPSFFTVDENKINILQTTFIIIIFPSLNVHM